MTEKPNQPKADEWVSFPGGELEGKRPKVLCPACRDVLKRAAVGRGSQHPKTLCFACYRAELDRQKAIGEAGRLETASDARFQGQLPFEPVDHPRLQMLKADRHAARAANRATTTGPFVDRRRHAQISARHALQQIAAALRQRQLAKADLDSAMASAFHAAELQLPDAWIPFVRAR
jgi:hypothetical protein